MVLIRPSQSPEMVLTFTRDEWDAFAAGIKGGDFD